MIILVLQEPIELLYIDQPSENSTSSGPSEPGKKD